MFFCSNERIAKGGTPDGFSRHALKNYRKITPKIPPAITAKTGCIFVLKKTKRLNAKNTKLGRLTVNWLLQVVIFVILKAGPKFIRERTKILTAATAIIPETAGLKVFLIL